MKVRLTTIAGALGFLAIGFDLPAFDDCGGRFLRRVVSMEYPPAARVFQLQGEVLLTAEVSEDGDVKRVDVRRGPPLLASPVKDVLSQWKFAPRHVSPGACQVSIKVNFALKGTCQRGTWCPTTFEVDFPPGGEHGPVGTVTLTSKVPEGPIY